MGALLRKANSDDARLASDAKPALRAVGIIPPSRRWTPVPLPVDESSETVRSKLADLLKSHADERRRGFFRLPSTRREEMLGILRKETSKGFWRECSVRGADSNMTDWCGWLYFPVDTQDKVRGCLDPAGVNELTHLLESCWAPGIDGVMALLGHMRRRLGRVKLRFCWEDWLHGFRQLALCADDGRFLCAVAWDAAMPKGEEIRVFEPLVHLFGARAGPNQFGRGSVGLLEIANVWLAICAVVHVDDTVIVDTDDEIDEARLLFVRLATLLQCQQNETKAMPPRTQAGGLAQGKCLGPTLTLPQTESELSADILCKLSLPADKVDKYHALLQHHRTKGCQPGAAAKLVGRMEWSASVAFGRAARAFLWPLRDRQHSASTDPALTPALDASLGALCGFVRNVRPLVLHSPDAERKIVYGFVDASSSAERQRACLGGLLLCHGGGAFFSKTVTSRDREWLPAGARSDINEFEALAAVTWLETFGGGLSSCDVLLFIDSACAEGALLRSYSSSRHLTALAGAFWTSAAGYDLRVWIGRVPSKLNPADGFSRGSRSLGQQLGWCQVPAIEPDVRPWRFLHAPTRDRVARRRLRNQGQ